MLPSNAPTLLTPEDFEAAAARLSGRAMKTPLLESSFVNETVGGRLLVKAEPLQRTGSFKFRGAFNTISQMMDEIGDAGVVAYSSGNHAQGVALAASLLEVRSTIVMPSDAPAIKIENTRAYGAHIVTYDRAGEDREAIGEQIMEDTGARLIRPYDDPRIIAGQGTVGWEIAHQAEELNAELDAVLVPCGGGGLVSGVALAVSNLSPATDVYSVEPVEFDDMARSLAAGERQGNSPDAKSICDALLAPMPGELTFSVSRTLLKEGLTVTDDEARAAMRRAFRDLKLVVEPGGAVALAAALTGKVDCRGRTVAVVCSGGNVDAAFFAEVLGS